MERFPSAFPRLCKCINLMKKTKKSSVSPISQREGSELPFLKWVCPRRTAAFLLSVALTLLLLTQAAFATSFSFSTGDPDGRIATLARPATPGLVQTETADDFILTQTTLLNQATFTGLLPSGA